MVIINTGLVLYIRKINKKHPLQMPAHRKGHELERFYPEDYVGVDG
jgi:hypothetical protein